MGKAGSTFLDANDLFPEMILNTVTGKTLQLPKGFGKGYGVILLYRGHW